MRPPVGPIGLYHLIFFGILLPWSAVRSKRRLAGRPQPARLSYYRAAFGQLAVFGTLSGLVAWREGIPVVPVALPPWWSLPLAAATTALLVAIMRPFWRARVLQRVPRTELVSPRTPAERLWWGLVSITAGIGEEVTYRGMMFALLWRLSGSVALATLVVAAIFAISHFIQGAKAMGLIFVFSLSFQALALLTGSLLTSMLVHAVYDFLAGLHYARYHRELART